MILDKKELEYVATAALIPYARNSRTHSETQVKQIASSIKEFGFTNPVLIDKDNGIIAGHGRVQAAELLNLDTVPCIRLSHLSNQQRRAYVIADNKIALNASWDFDMLKLDLSELADEGFDFESIGFTQMEINNIISDYEAAFETTDDEEHYVTSSGEPKESDIGYVTFSILLSTDDKKVLLDKISDVREKYSLDTMAESFMTIIKSYA